jgi:DNA-binding CsgD family transcriptional regulator
VIVASVYGRASRHGDPLTALVLEIHLDQRELAVLNQTKAGKSQRQIADFLGLKSATPVNRIVRRLGALGMLP